MSTTNTLLLIDDERKAQLDLLNKIDPSGKNDSLKNVLLNLVNFSGSWYLQSSIRLFIDGTQYEIDYQRSKWVDLSPNILKQIFSFIFLDRLQLDVDTVRTTIDSLLWLYTECAKTKISNDALEESLKLLGFNATIRQSFIECYSSKASLLQSTLSTDLALSLPRYKNLNWRFDVQVRVMFTSRGFIQWNLDRFEEFP